MDLDPSVERWGTNRMMLLRYGGDFDIWTRWFDLHRTPHILKQRPEAYDWYRKQDGRRPIYQWEVNDDIPGSAAYPREAVQAYFSESDRVEREFWGSISWLVALAIYEQFEQIDLFWFVMDSHINQVPSARYWIGQARGRGIAVKIHGDSMLKPSGPIYGYETT